MLSKSLQVSVGMASLPVRMDPVSLVFVAIEFQNVGIGQQPLGELDAERLGVQFGIVKGRFDVHVSEIPAVVTLNNAQAFAMRMAERIEPSFVVEARRLNQ